LRSVGYEVRRLGEPEAFVPAELLDGVDVLLLGPGLDADGREEYLGALAGTLETAAIPMLSFSSVPKGTTAEEDRLVLWPCKIEDLAREIEAVLPRRQNQGGLETALGS